MGWLSIRASPKKILGTTLDAGLANAKVGQQRRFLCVRVAIQGVNVFYQFGIGLKESL